MKSKIKNVLIILLFAIVNCYGQKIYENKVFSFEIPDNYEVFDNNTIQEFNRIQKKKEWNQNIFGITDNLNYNVLFQIIEVNKSIKSLKEFQDLFMSDEIQRLSKERGIEVLNTIAYNSNLAVLNESYNINHNEYIYAFNFINKMGFVSVKLFALERLELSELNFIRNGFKINSDFKGYPSYNFFHGLDWNEIFLNAVVKTITGTKIKTKKKN